MFPSQTYPSDTGFAFRCQHGPSECRGNKLQACGLARLLGDNKKQVKFVNCVMSQTNPSRPSEKVRSYSLSGPALQRLLLFVTLCCPCVVQCLTEVGLRPEEVKDCAAGREGQVLLAGMGEKTPRNIDFVPTVNFNGVT